MRKRLLSSILVVSLVGFFAVNLTNSFFSDTETSSGNTFTAGKVDLKIDNESYYNGVFYGETSWTPADLTDHKFFDFSDLKPSDWGEDTISLTIENNDAWLCADIVVTKDDDNDCNEPELLDDPSCSENDDPFDGEVGGLVNMVFWVDDGDNVFETDETPFEEGTALEVLTDASWALAQSGPQQGRILLDSDLNGNGSAVGGQTYYIAKYWCFGNLQKTPVNEGEGVDPTVATGFSCDGASINNASQTDSLLADISFYAEQARHNPEFRCKEVECIEEEVWAYNVETSDQGDRKNGTSVLPERSDPNDTLGHYDGVGSPASGFYSLGFGGSITIKFENPVGNISVDDLSIHEITNGRSSYPLESAKVEVSQDGLDWFELTEQATSQHNESDPGVTLLEISASGYPWIQYVRITDTTNPNIHGDIADGFDLDAVDGQSVCQ